MDRGFSRGGYPAAACPSPFSAAPCHPSIAYAAAACDPAAAAASQVHIALVSMVKQPTNLPTWLRYHCHVLGVERFYIRLEDSPELAELLSRAPFAGKLSALFVMTFCLTAHFCQRRQLAATGG